VLGGYGVVGRRLVRSLCVRHPGRIVIAGRRLEVGLALAHELGHGVTALRVDVEDEKSVSDALKDTAVVVSCVEQRADIALKAALRRGLRYGDLAPKLALRGDPLELDAAAKRTGARLVMGIGISPGLSSVMARALCDRLGGPPDRIETALLYGMGDEFGGDSLGFILRSATRAFDVVVDGTRQSMVPFSGAQEVEFPAPFGRRTAYAYPFSDAVTFPRTLGARTAIARLAIDPGWLGRLASAAAHLRLLAALAPRVRGSRRVRALLAAHDGYALVVTAQRGGARVRMSLHGRRQAEATALVTTELVDRLVRGEPSEPGLWMPEQYVEPSEFFARLRSVGLSVADDD
jgi:saccharopine dehydrogenase (NAD+, L-lysine-forming)